MRVDGQPRRGVSRAALVAVACAFGVATLAVGTARADSGTLTVTYTSSTSLQAALGGGAAVTSGSSVPAGSYLLEVKDDPNTGDLNPNFTFSGPGATVSSNLDSSGMGIDGLSTFGPFNLQTGASYSIEDTTLGSSTLISFTVSAAAGGSTATTTSTPAATTSVTSTPSSSSGGKTTTTAVTSAAKGGATIGTLEGSISSSAHATVSFGGKALRSLKAGRYRLSLNDHSKSLGLVLGNARERLSFGGTGASGTSSHTVTLTAGTWFYELSAHGTKVDFTVVG